MASELDRIRIPSPLPEGALQHIPLQDPVALREWLIKLHYLVNSTVPINKLPAELLGEIMCLSAEEDRILPWRPDNVMLTCRHWYIIVVSTARIWTRIVAGMRISLLDTYLRRSRRAGISLITSLYGDVDKRPLQVQTTFLQRLIPHLDRVVYLETGAFQPYLNYPMARLISMVVKNSWTRQKPRPEDLIHIRCNQYPRLRSLTLWAASCPTIIAGTSSLVSLKVANPKPGTWSALFRMLQSCPALEHLEIHSLCKISNDSGQYDVTLHKLRELMIDDCGPGTSVILAHLILPRIVKIAIQTPVFVGADEGDNDGRTTRIRVTDFFPDDKSLLPVLAAISEVQSVVTGDRLRIVAITSGDSQVETQSITYLGDHDPEFEPMDTSWAQRGAMHQLGAIFPPSVKVLHIRLESREPRDQPVVYQLADGWRSLYAAFPNLEELYASGPDMEFFFDFLFDLSPYESSSRHSALAWPGLKRIRLEYLSGTSQLQPAEPEELLHAITAVMHNRRSATSVEHLQELGIVFSGKPLQNLQTCFNRMRGTADKIVCIVAGEEVALGEDAILSDMMESLDYTGTVD